MSYDYGFQVSPVVQQFMDNMGDASTEGQFDIAKSNATAAIKAALEVSGIDPVLAEEYTLLLQIVDMSRYLPEPQVHGGVSALDLLRSMASMVGLAPDAMLEIAKLLIDAARDQATSTAQARAQYMQGTIDAANAQYECDIQAAEDARNAAVIESATQIAVSSVSMILSGIALKYAGDASESAEKVGAKQTEISGLKAGLAGKQGQALQDDHDTIARLTDEIAHEQARLTACNAISGAVNTFARTLETFAMAPAKVGASFLTERSKVEEAESKLYASGQQLETAMRNASDDGYRACADLVSSVLDLLKSTATMTFKAPVNG
jgi:hypothetical protein